VIAQQVIEDACEWAIMHGVAFRQVDNSARHCPFSIAPMTMKRNVYQHLCNVTPMVAKLINRVSEDHDFLQVSLGDVAKADPFLAI
jgi:glutathione synthase